MANTYSQLYIHIVFAVKGRKNLISEIWKDELFKYITGIVSNKKQKLLIINGIPNHIHILASIKPDICISDLVRDIKANSSRFINERHLVIGKFEWQNGFGAFTVSHSNLDKIFNYIRTQEEHHKINSFKNEYAGILQKHEIEYDPKYIFEDPLV